MLTEPPIDEAALIQWLTGSRDRCLRLAGQKDRDMDLQESDARHFDAAIAMVRENKALRDALEGAVFYHVVNCRHMTSKGEQICDCGAQRSRDAIKSALNQTPKGVES